jgi:transcriptional regulator with XRE-family HTH domain
MAKKFTKLEKSEPPDYGRVRSPDDLGRLVRGERRHQGLTLEGVYSASGLTTRFLSELERGKPNASLGRVMDALQALGLELIILPRGEAERLLSARHRHRTDDDA